MRYLSIFICLSEETTPLRVLLMESSSQVKISCVRFMFCITTLGLVVFFPGYPVPQISMLGMCCVTCELDSITRSLTFVRQPEFFPTLKFGVGGESPTRCKGVMVFTCELDSTY